MNFLHHRLSSLPCQSSGRGEKAAKGMGRVLTKHKLFFRPVVGVYVGFPPIVI